MHQLRGEFASDGCRLAPPAGSLESHLKCYYSSSQPSSHVDVILLPLYGCRPVLSSESGGSAPPPAFGIGSNHCERKMRDREYAITRREQHVNTA
jgi:hypothetical protein